MPNQSLTIEQVLTLLPQAPQRITAMTVGLANAQLHTPPGEGEWSANDVLAHLRACADVWGGCITTILAEDTPTLRALNPRTWIDKTDYLEQPFQPSLRAYSAQRNKLLRVLKPLPRCDWSRKATVTGAGKPLERTALLYAKWLVVHERPHIKQIERIVKTMHN
jgi:DinB superfamily